MNTHYNYFICEKSDNIGKNTSKELDGKKLSIKTFQDGEMEYQMDLKDFRIVNKDIEKLIILIDVNLARNGQFLFFFIEPTEATIYNKDLFSTVLIDKRYLEYNQEMKSDIKIEE